MDIEELISIVTLKKIGDNKFEGQNYKTVWGRIFGGQVLSQSLHAAYQTVPEDRIAHSMHGYFILPGDLKEKVDPYLTPLYDALNDMLPKDKLKLYLANKTIEIAPLAYMRGRTLHNSFMILDEAQNATQTQMKMFLTRLGVTSKAIITGDITQIDLPPSDKSGLSDAANVLDKIKGIDFIYFDAKDVVRHQLVKNIIRAYDKDNEKK